MKGSSHRAVSRRGLVGVAAVALALTLLPASGGAVAQGAPRNLTPAETVDDLSPLIPGPLAVEVAGGSWDVNGFTVTLDSETGVLEVRDTARGETVWATVPGTAFIVGSTSRLRVFEDQGAFWPHVKRTKELTRQTISAATQADDSTLSLRGFLSDGEQRVSWSMLLGSTQLSEDVSALSLQVRTGRKRGKQLDSVLVSFARDSGEAVHGFGSQYRPYDLSGSVFPIMVREQGVGRGEQPISQLVNGVEPGGAGTLANTYAAWPAWLTSSGRAGRVVGPAATQFGIVDVRSPQALTVEMRASSLRVQLVSGGSPAEALRRRDAGTTIPGIADWTADGAILGLQGGTAEVRTEIQTVLDAGAEISAVWLQDWVGRRTTSFGDRLWWVWQLDREWYPGWEELVDDLDAQGIKVLTYVNPMLTNPATKQPPPARNLFQEARRNDYFVERPNGRPYLQDQGQFSAALIDLTKPRARAWYIDVIATEVLAGKVAGFMADFGEGLPYDAVLKGGSGAELHNEYPLLWAETVREACVKAGKPECVTWFRSGIGASAASAPMFWGGDQMVSFAPEDGMPSALYGIHASGASGWPLMHSDVGGYTSVALVNYVRAPDLLPRWAQMEAFGVFMRTHEGNQPARNLQVYSNPDQAAAFAYATRIYSALGDYRREVVAEAIETRMPALRHPSLVWPGTAAATVDEAFFLGEHLFVTPVMSRGATTVEVTFPPGTWIHALTGEEFTGGATVTVDAPLDQATAFVLKGDPVGEQIRQALLDAGVAT